MITIYPNGGIGNQLFQYAAGRALSLAKSTKLVVDTWHFGPYPESGDRPLLLHKLGLEAEIKLYQKNGVHNPFSPLNKLNRRFLRPFLSKHVHESDLTTRDFFSLNANTTLIGYFQSTRYFNRYIDTIISDLDISKLICEQTKGFIDLHPLQEYCAIQVRRTDFLNHPLFDVLSFEDYYPTAIDLMRHKFGFKNFIVFSDDPSWCEAQNLFRGMLIHRVVLENTPIDALSLIGHCGGRIIANSSYGWWAAVIGDYHRKGRTIMPNFWLKNSRSADRGLICEDWDAI